MIRIFVSAINGRAFYRLRHITASVGETTLRQIVALTFFRSLKTFRLTFLRMRNKCKIINVQRNDKGFSV